MIFCILPADILGVILVKVDTLSRRRLAETSKVGILEVPRILRGTPRLDILGRPSPHKIARAENARYKAMALRLRADGAERVAAGDCPDTYLAAAKCGIPVTSYLRNNNPAMIKAEAIRGKHGMKSSRPADIFEAVRRGHAITVTTSYSFRGAGRKRMARDLDFCRLFAWVVPRMWFRDICIPYALSEGSEEVLEWISREYPGIRPSPVAWQYF